MPAEHYSIEVDPSGIIKVFQKGFWSATVAKSFIEEAKPVVSAAQGRGTMRLIIDATEFLVPSADVSAILAKFDAIIRRDDDRVAMVVASSLLKIQMKRQIVRKGLEVFTSYNAASTWVEA